MVRSAAKNYKDVAIVTDPEDYQSLLAELAINNQKLSPKTRFALAKKAFAHTARYDAAIANWLTAIDDDPQAISLFPGKLQMAFDRVEILRYGENPHQKAAFYRDVQSDQGVVSAYIQVQGKELSYNNIADADAAWECVKTFTAPSCVIIKHANPCGVAVGDSLLAAYEKAFKTDSVSAFGGIIAFNDTVDESVIAAMDARKHFVEVLIAPAFTTMAKTMLEAKHNLRVLEIPMQKSDSTHFANTLEMKRIGGGLLVQTQDALAVTSDDLKVVTKKEPTPSQIEDLLFAWKVVKFVKSNAVIFCGNGMTLGVGAGQMSRVDSVRIACIKAQHAGLSLTGSCVASDAFFPFRDGLDAVAEAGAKAVIQPGGSVRDEEVITAANERGIAMVFSGARHFRH